MQYTILKTIVELYCIAMHCTILKIVEYISLCSTQYCTTCTNLLACHHQSGREEERKRDGKNSVSYQIF